MVIVGTVQHDLWYGLRAAPALLQQPFTPTRRARVRGAEQGREVRLPMFKLINSDTLKAATIKYIFPIKS